MRNTIRAMRILESMPIDQVAERLNVPMETLRDWENNPDLLLELSNIQKERLVQLYQMSADEIAHIFKAENVDQPVRWSLTDYTLAGADQIPLPAFLPRPPIQSIPAPVIPPEIAAINGHQEPCGRTVFMLSCGVPLTITSDVPFMALLPHERHAIVKALTILEDALLFGGDRQDI